MTATSNVFLTFDLLPDIAELSDPLTANPIRQCITALSHQPFELLVSQAEASTPHLTIKSTYMRLRNAFELREASNDFIDKQIPKFQDAFDLFMNMS
jgi:hypothetical protein